MPFMMKKPIKKAASSMTEGLATAYAVKKKAGKKPMMAEGGEVSAANEKRPSTQETADDKTMVSRNSSIKPSKMDGVLDQSTVKQAQKPSLTKLSRPTLKKGTGPFSVRYSDMEDEEKDLISNDPPAPDTEEPSTEHDELDAKKKGPSSKDLSLKMMAEGGKVKTDSPSGEPKITKTFADVSREHNRKNNRPPSSPAAAEKEYPHRILPEYAKGGIINEEESMHDAEMDQVDEPAGLESDNDEMSPHESEFMAGRFAEGGMADDMDQPMSEDEEMEHASLAAQIMMKNRKAKAMAEGGMYADGGEVDLEENRDEQPNAYYAKDKAILKENYGEDLEDMNQPIDSNEESPEHEEEDVDDKSIVSAIRRKMKAKSPITK